MAVIYDSHTRTTEPLTSTIYGVPMATWDTWTLDRRAKYLQQYDAPDPFASGDCFTHGDGRTTCYSDQTDLEKLAYTYTYGVDTLTGLEGEQIGADLNATVEDTKEKISDALQTGSDVAFAGLVLAGLYLLRG